MTVADPGGLEVRGHGNRSASAVFVLYRYDSGHHRDPHGRSSHIRIRGPGQNHRNLPREVSSGALCPPLHCHAKHMPSASARPNETPTGLDVVKHGLPQPHAT